MPKVTVEIQSKQTEGRGRASVISPFASSQAAGTERRHLEAGYQPCMLLPLSLYSQQVLDFCRLERPRVWQASRIRLGWHPAV